MLAPIVAIFYLARGILVLILADFIIPSFTVLISGRIWIPPVVRVAWGFMRDFVNLFFILALIVMAFGTIFNIKKYTYREMLVPFLVVALLINFSFGIGEYMINLSNQLSNVFLTTMKNAMNNDLISMFTTGLSMGTIAAGAAGAGSTSWLGRAWDTVSGVVKVVFSPEEATKAITNSLLTIIFIGFALFAFLVIIFFLIARVPMIWILLIVSPIALFGYLLPPEGRKKTWTLWWDQFIGWVLFVPTYLFILMFLALMLGAKSSSTLSYADTAALSQGDAETAVNWVMKFLGGEEIIFFLLTLTFMVGGIWLSFQVGKLFKGSAGWVAGKAMTLAASIPIARGQSLASLYSGAREGAAYRGGQILERGGEAVPLIGGTRLAQIWGGRQKQRERAGAFAEVFGLKHAEAEARAKNIEAEKARLLRENPNLTAATANTIFGKATGAERLAMAQIIAEKGWIDQRDPAAAAKQIKANLDAMGGAESAAGSAYLKTVNEKITDTTTNELFSSPDTKLGSVEWQAYAMQRAERGLLSPDPATKVVEVQNAITSMGGPDSEAGKKYWDKVRPRLIKDEANSLFTAATGRLKLQVAQHRAEKGWMGGHDEITEMLKELPQGSEERKKYLTSLEASGFNYQVADPAAPGGFRSANVDEKLAFAGTAGLLFDLKKKLFSHLATRNQLNNEGAISDYLETVKFDSVEDRVKAEQQAVKNISNIVRTPDDRRAYVRNTAKPQELRRIAALNILESGDVNGVAAYRTVETLLGSDQKMLEFNAKMAKDTPLLHAQITGGPQYRDNVRRAIADMDTKPLMNGSDDAMWGSADFIAEVQAKINALQQDAPPSVDAQNNRIPGKGEVYLRQLQRLDTTGRTAGLVSPVQPPPSPIIRP